VTARRLALRSSRLYAAATLRSSVFFHYARAPPDLHSFPTRRSSDLCVATQEPCVRILFSFLLKCDGICLPPLEMSPFLAKAESIVSSGVMPKWVTSARSL